MFQETFRFTLPRGIPSNNGYLKEGTMRLATAGDEIRSAAHPESRKNPEYIGIILLAAVTSFDGFTEPVTPAMIESLIVADYTFLQNMFTTINEPEEMKMRITCPKCGEVFFEAVNFTNPV